MADTAGAAPPARAPGPRSRAARSRRRDVARLRAAIILLLLIAGGAAAVWWTLRADQRVTAHAGQPTACGTPSPAAALPRVRVLNSTNRPGLATAVADLLRARGFTVTDVGNDPHAVAGPAELRYGPHGLAAARTVLGVVPGAARRPDTRRGADVDLVLGNRFSRLAPAPPTPRLTASPMADSTPSPRPCPSPALTTPTPRRS